ncbi:hypothetical protein DFR81_10542 [Garciella nitratireducens]|nr:hypothetical protein DFR81_10542 [Garciella nitratireducens]
MVEYENKGMMNSHTVVNNDYFNISNNNKQLYSKIFSGDTDSPMISYLLNLNNQILSVVLVYNCGHEKFNTLQYL